MGFILVYCGLLEIVFGSQLIYSALFEHKIKKLGYVNLDKSILGVTFYLKPSDYLLITFFPVFNLIWLGDLLTFKESSKDALQTGLKNGRIKNVELVEENIREYSEDNHKLALKVLKVRKAQAKYKKKLAKKEVNHKMLMTEIESTYRDLSIPEKIVAVRNIQQRSNMVNPITPISEYTLEERLVLLLAELEIVYRELAQKEGVDSEELEREISLILDGTKCMNEKK